MLSVPALIVYGICADAGATFDPGPSLSATFVAHSVRVAATSQLSSVLPALSTALPATHKSHGAEPNITVLPKTPAFCASSMIAALPLPMTALVIALPAIVALCTCNPAPDGAAKPGLETLISALPMLPESALPATTSSVPGPVMTTPEPGPEIVLPPMKM